MSSHDRSVQHCRTRALVGAVIAALLTLGATACGAGQPAASSTTTAGGTSMASSMPAAMTASMTPDAMTPAGSASSSDSVGTPVAAAAWQDATFTLVDGSTGSVSDYIGTPVYVEFFATWCPSCFYALQTVAEAAATEPDAVFLVLSVETDVTLADVAKYQTDASFTAMTFGLLTPEMLATAVDDLGTTVINPPATPHLIVDRTGVAGPLLTGKPEVEGILSQLDATG